MKVKKVSNITQLFEEDSQIIDLIELAGSLKMELDEDSIIIQTVRLDSIIIQTVRLNSALDLEGY
jgi:hypothetical protein